MKRRVFVSGCFDMLHSGHVAFFESAAAFGTLTVAIGSDRTILELKGRPPVNSEAERQYMVQSIRCVERCIISRGSGILDFALELQQEKPDLFVVNADGDSPQKRELCESVGIEYFVLDRVPFGGLPVRSTTALRLVARMPYRIDIAGGWLDQPFVSRLAPGAVITVSIEAPRDDAGFSFTGRSGMATSTREKAIELFGPHGFPVSQDSVKVAKILFAFDNPPGTTNISGSQDAIGLAVPGLCFCLYEGDYWPASIERVTDEDHLLFVEQHLYLVPLSPREEGYDPFSGMDVTSEKAHALAAASRECWEAVLCKDAVAFGRAVTSSFNAQVAMFPAMMNESVHEVVEKYRSLPGVTGYKVSGAGGGGYVIFVSTVPVAGGFKVTARRGF